MENSVMLIETVNDDVVPQSDHCGVYWYWENVETPRRLHYPADANRLRLDLEEAVRKGAVIKNNTMSGIVAEMIQKAHATAAIERITPTVDMVEAPVHYRLPGLNNIEVLDVRRSLCSTIPLGTDYFAVTAWSEAITYLARMWNKNGLEDARKAQFYVNKLVETLSNPTE